MNHLNDAAFAIGWAVLGAAGLIGLCAAWWWVGDKVWGLLPDAWRQAQYIPVPQPRYGDYIPPAVSRKALVLMLALGGPAGWVRLPSMLKANRTKKAIIQRGGDGVAEPDEDESWLEEAEAQAEIHADWEREENPDAN